MQWRYIGSLQLYDSVAQHPLLRRSTRLIQAAKAKESPWRMPINASGIGTAFIAVALGVASGFPRIILAEPQSAATDELPMVDRSSRAAVEFSIRGAGDDTTSPQLFTLERQYSQHTANTVFDASTGLLWQQHDDDIMRTWEQAKTYCQSLSLDGVSQWRLPRRSELMSLIDFNQIRPAIDTRFFPGTDLFNYWALTEYTGTTEHAWTVLFAEGNVYCFRKILQSYTRCVTTADV